jgi:hypothetical protein
MAERARQVFARLHGACRSARRVADPSGGAGQREEEEDSPSSVAPAMLRCSRWPVAVAVAVAACSRACSRARRWWVVVPAGEVAPSARRERTGRQSPRAAASHLQRPPQQLRGRPARTPAPNCPLHTHVEPSARRLGGRVGVALLPRRRQEHAAHRRLRAAVPVYVAVPVAAVLELSWSSANTAQPSS